MKKILKLISSILILFAISTTAVYSAINIVPNGGTGRGTLDLGECLVGNGISPILSVPCAGGGGINIYNSDGTLTGARTVTSGGNNLLFLMSGTSGFSVDGGTAQLNVNANSDVNLSGGNALIQLNASDDTAQFSFPGGLTLTNGLGTAGQVFTSNGNAGPTWEDAGAAGGQFLIGQTSGLVSNPSPVTGTETWFGEGAGTGMSTNNTVAVGVNAGSGATNSQGAIMIGTSSGTNASNAVSAVFIGGGAAVSATNAVASVFIGGGAGAGATNANSAIYIGEDAGNSSTDALRSVFIGSSAGSNAANANNALFAGYQAGTTATNAEFSVFLGVNAGTDATNALQSIFLGQNSGRGATNAANAIFMGQGSGFNATDAIETIAIGTSAGDASTAASNGVFLGSGAGGNLTGTSSNIIAIGTNAANTATDATEGIFIGRDSGGGATASNNVGGVYIGTEAGFQATDDNFSNFIGYQAGRDSTSSDNVNFFGQSAGRGSSSVQGSNFFGENAGRSASGGGAANFFGQNAGQNAVDAANSNFFGQSAGENTENATNSIFIGSAAGQATVGAPNSIFIGNAAGLNDTVDNTGGGTSILIGENTNTGGFSNSIALGAGAVNTASNQFLVQANYINWSIAGVDYIMPPALGVAGSVLTDVAGDGTLTWEAGGAGGTVTDFIFTDGSGFDGTVSTSTTTPTLSLTTSLTTGSVPFIGAAGALNEDNAQFFYDNTNDRLGLGTITPTSKLTVSGNTATLPTPPIAGTGIHLGGADSAQTNITMDGFGAVPQLISRRASGTAASPSALAFAGLNLFNFVTSGYGTSAYSTPVNSISIKTTQAWTNTAQGTQIVFSTTANGATAATDNVVIDHTGFVGIGDTTPSYRLDVAETSSSTIQRAANIILSAGYTGAARTDGIFVQNDVAGTGQNLNVPALNAGGTMAATATTTGYNVGMRGIAFGSSSHNIGFYGDATGTGANNIGAFGRGDGGSVTSVGGYFTTQSPNAFPTISTSSALIADNGSGSSNIFTAQDNGTAVFNIINGGNTGINQTAPGAKLHINTNNFGVTQADSTGIILENNQAATVGLQQYSPSLTLIGSSWTTNAGGNAQVNKIRMDVSPIQKSTSVASPILRFQQSTGGAAYSDLFGVGYFGAGGTGASVQLEGTTFFTIGAGVNSFVANGTSGMNFLSSANLIRLVMNNSGEFSHTPAALSGSGATTAWSLAQTWNTSGSPAALVVDITNTASGSTATLASFRVGGVASGRVSLTGQYGYGSDVNVGIGSANAASAAAAISGQALRFFSNPNNTVNSYEFWFFPTGARTSTSGTNGGINYASTFSPTSGTGTYAQVFLNPTINQTGGANGITRGLYVNPVLTAAADFRAIEVSAGKSIFGGNVFIGAVTSPTAVLHLAAGTASANTAPLKFTSGTINTAAEAGTHEYNGNHYLSNANIRFSVGGTLFDYFTDSSVGGAETDIYTSTLAASTLGVNGAKVIANYAGNFVTGGTELTQLKVYFAGTAIWDSTGVAPTTGTTSWNVDVKIIRVSATVIRYSVTLNTTGASGFVYANSGELTGLTLSGTNIIKITGTSSGVGSGAGDIVGKSGYILFQPAN